MNNLYRIFFVLGLFFLPGCITVYEKYTFNSNGSGTMEYLIDMSEFYTMMNSFSGSLPDEDIQIDQSFMEIAEELKNIKGVSNVQLTGNNQEYIFGIKYDFSDPPSLNRAMAFILQKKYDQVEYLSIKGKNITRYSSISEEFSTEKIIGNEENEMDETMIKEIFEKMNYKIYMDFFRPVKSVVTKANYTIDNNKLIVEANFGDILQNNKILETSIRLK